jgi:hypothetical protein
MHSIIVKCDFSIGSGPSIVRDACQEIPGNRGSGNQGFRRQRNLIAGNHDPRYPDSDVSVMGLPESEWRTGVRHSRRVGKSVCKRSGNL